MKYDPVYIAIGTLILIITSYILVSFYSFLYLKFIAHTKKFEWGKVLLSSAVVSAAWLVATVLSIWLAGSVSAWVFAAVSLAILFVVFYYSSEKLFGVTKLHKVYFSLFLAILLNPAWFVLIGVI